MKYTLIAMMLGLAGVATAGQSVVAQAPVQVAATTPVWGVEVAGNYNFGLGQFLKKGNALGKKNHVNTVGGDITGVYNIDENNAVTLRFGYNYGSDKFAMWSPIPSVGLSARERLHSFTLMPGYRYTVALDERWSVFAGANVGLAANSVKLSEHVSIDRRSDMTFNAHKSAWGLAWSVEAGAKYQLDANWYAFGAVSYSGNTARPSVRFNGYNVGKMKTQQYLGVRLGVGVQF